MPFGTNAPLRVMLVSRLMMRASGRTRVNSCRAAPQIGELDSSWASSVHLLGKADVILADLRGHMGGIGFDLYLFPSLRFRREKSERLPALWSRTEIVQRRCS